MTTATRERPNSREGFYIFQRYTIDELARRMGYRESYLLAMKLGYQPIREIVRLKAAKVLGVSEEVLFAEAN